MEIVFKSGKLHHDADALSRNPVDPPESEPELPLFLLGLSPQVDLLKEQQNRNGVVR